MAPDILPVATSFLKKSPTFASLSGLKWAPAGISKVPSARPSGTASSATNAPQNAELNNLREFIGPLPGIRNGEWNGGVTNPNGRPTHAQPPPSAPRLPGH